MPRFSIRDELWFTLVVGLVLGWGVDRWWVVDWARREERQAASYRYELEQSQMSERSLKRRITDLEQRVSQPSTAHP